MKFKEIKEQYNSIVEEKEQIEFKKNLEINSIKLSFDKMENIINFIKDSVLIEENGYVKNNVILLEIYKIYFLAKSFIGVEIEEDDDIYDIYDFIVDNEIHDYFEYTGNSKYDKFAKLLNDVIETEIKSRNSIEAILAKGINTIANKIPDEKGINKLIKSIGKEIGKLDNEKIANLKTTFGIKDQIS